MVAKRLIRSVGSRLRTTVALAMMPLAIVNAWPVSLGCICADGHYEPLCNVRLCRAGVAGCGCSCCADGASIRVTSRCGNGNQNCCCHRRSETSPQNNDGGKQIAGNGCCTPIVHAAPPAVITLPQTIDARQTQALILTAVELPSSFLVANVRHGVELETSPPPHDLVVVLQRLVI